MCWGKKVEREQESEVQFRTWRATYAGAEVVGAEHHAVVVEANAVSEAAGFLAYRLQKKHHSHWETNIHTHRDSSTLRYYTSHSVLLRRVLQALVHSGQSKQPHNDESRLSASGIFTPPFDVNLLLSKRQKTIHGKFRLWFRKEAK